MKLLPFKPGQLGPKVRRSGNPAETEDFFREGPNRAQPLPDGPLTEDLLHELSAPVEEGKTELSPSSPEPMDPRPSNPLATSTPNGLALSKPSEPSSFLRGKHIRSPRHFSESNPRTEDTLSAFGRNRHSSSRHSSGDNVVPFRRRRRLKRLRRHPLLRLLKPLGLATAIVSMPVGAGLWLVTSPRFSLQDVVIKTGERVPNSWVETTLQPAMGRNLPTLSLQQLERRLERHAWVAGIDLRKELPGRLLLEVVEKKEVALLREGKELSYLDVDGEVIAPFDPTKGTTDQVLVSLSPDSKSHGEPSAAIELLDEIAETRASWASDLSEIEILGRDDFKVYSTVLPFPLLVRKGMVEKKARRLEALMPQLLARYHASAAVDLRFARRIILQPSVEGSPAANRVISPVGLAEQSPGGIS